MSQSTSRVTTQVSDEQRGGYRTEHRTEATGCGTPLAASHDTPTPLAASHDTGRSPKWRPAPASLRGLRPTLLLTLLALSACNAPGPTTGPAADGPATTPDQVARMPLEPNVVSIATYYTPYNPWLWTADRSRVQGIVINALYLGGPNNMGVFGDGVIRPTLYLLDSSKEARQPPRLLKQWSLSPDQAMPFRAKKQTAMGWGYGRVPLVWGDEFDLGGREIRMTVSFERRDGTVVHSGKKDFRVPPSGP